MKFFARCSCAVLALAAVLGAWLEADAQPAGNEKKSHRLIVYPAEGETPDQLRAEGVEVQDYGSYWVVRADKSRADAVRQKHAGRASRADHFDRIELSATRFDTSVGEPAMPASLRERPTPGHRLRLVQFVGPVLGEWLKQIEAAGNIKIVSYVPNNSYVVWLDAKAERRLQQLLAPAGPIQWMGAYHPFYKLKPALAETPGSAMAVRVAVVDAPGTDEVLSVLQSYSQQALGKPARLLNQHVVRLVVHPQVVPQIAQIPEVLWIEQVVPMEAKDEKLGLISASRTNQLPGHAPVPGVDNYLLFLTNSPPGGVGFRANSTEYPVISVADTLAGDGFFVPGVFRDDFFEFGDPSRQHRQTGYVSLCEPTAILCSAGGHATFVTSIAVGANTNNVPSNLDAENFRLGLGVSPFGRFANAVIFKEVSGACVVCDDDFLFAELPLNQYLLHRGRISNNSWGENLVAGSGGNAGVYGSSSLAFDISVRDSVETGSGGTAGPSPVNQEMIMVFAAGNSNGQSPSGGFGDVIVTPPATAKNIITVGASENVRAFDEAVNDCFLFADDADNSFDISFFSSFGPTADGRFKPEIVAPGAGVFGADELTDDTYNCSAGTSFAAPAVSGGIQLLWWWFQNALTNEVGQPFLQPSPAMAKAYLCNSARYLPITNPQTGVQDSLPSIAQGMGIMDLQRMFDRAPRVIRDQTAPRAIDTPLLTTNTVLRQTYFSQSGQSYELSGVVADSSRPFRVTLAWTDAPGNPAALRQLVNDLDLEVTIGDKTYRGNVFVGPHSISVDVPHARNVPDAVNNMESVFLPAGGPVVAGAAWRAVVRAVNIAGEGVPNVGASLDQDFALVVYNATMPSDVANLGTNDACQTAVAITALPFSNTSAVSGANYRNVHPSPSVARGGIEQFFKIVNPTLGATINVDTFGSDFDTVLSVWKGECGALVELAANDNASNSLQSTLSFVVDETNTYYIVVEGRANATGTAVLNVSTPGPQIFFQPSVLDFGEQVVGTTSAVHNVALVNATPNRLDVQSLLISGLDAGLFRLAGEGCTDASIPPGGSCTIGLQFLPVAEGLRSNAFLAVVDNALGSPRLLLLVGRGVTCPVLTLSPSQLPTAIAGIAYSQSLTASGNPPFTFSLSSGALPPGLTLSSAGVITGIPTLPGNYDFSVTALDARGCAGTATYRLVVACRPLAILPLALPAPLVGNAYVASFSVSNAVPPVTFFRTNGQYPPGLTMSSDGVISGTPTQTGSFSFQVNFVDATGCGGQRVYTLNVGCPALVLLPGSLPLGQIGLAYFQSLTATGGVPPYVFTQTGGSLPAGLTLSADGEIAGTPTSGSSVFTVTVTDANGCRSDTTYTLLLADPPPAIFIGPSVLNEAAKDTAFSQQFSATGGVAPHTFAVSGGALPAGIALSPAGKLSGTPSAEGESSFTVTATDAAGLAGSRAYTLKVKRGLTDLRVALAQSADTVTEGDEVIYTVTVTNSGASPAHNVAVTGSATGHLGAIQPGASASFNVRIMAAGVGTHTFSVNVACDEADSNVANNTASLQTQVTARPPSSTAQFRATGHLVDAGADFVVLTVSRTGNIHLAGNVGFATSDGSARAGVDYQAVSGTIGFAAGESVRTISVPLLKNNATGSRSFNVALRNPSGAVALGAPAQAQVTIVKGRAANSFAVAGTRVRLTGAGQLSVALNASGIQEINIQGTDLRSRLVISGALSNARIQVAGALGGLRAPALDNVRVLAGAIESVRVGVLTDSLIAAGYSATNENEPMGGGSFASQGVIKSVRLARMAGSTIAAVRVGDVKIGQVTPDNGGHAFGILAGGSIGSVKVSAQKFVWQAGGANDQALGDFHVKK